MAIIPSMKETHTKIRQWYKSYGRRDLPWRITEDPYHIYLSEIMLQQTQVKTVLERYYFPFLKKFPTLQSLGEAPLDDVLKIWEGLGYYNRAKNLHKTAQILLQRGQVQNIAPALPCDIDALVKLPGIGKNTAHAVATFAFRQPVPVMEANVKRILCRLNKLRTPKEKKLWELAYALVDNEDPFDYNQAMMDIGATVCTPKDPQCSFCPLETVCEGKEMPEHYPLKKKKQIPTRDTHIMISVCNEKLALTKRSGKFLHGLWGFESTDDPLCAAEYLGEITHTYTHFKLRCKIWLYHELEAGGNHYFTIGQIKKLAISKVDEKIVKLYLDTI